MSARFVATTSINAITRGVLPLTGGTLTGAVTFTGTFSFTNTGSFTNTTTMSGAVNFGIGSTGSGGSTYLQLTRSADTNGNTQIDSFIAGGGSNILSFNTVFNNPVAFGTGTFSVAGAITNTASTIQYLGTTTNTGDTYAVAPSVALTALTKGAIYFVQVNSTNTTTTPTLNISALGAKTIVKRASTAMAASDMLANGMYAFIYNGTNMQCLNPAVP